MQRRLGPFGLGLALLPLLFLSIHCQKKKAAVEAEKEKYLLIWAGDQARKASDFLAVVNFDPASADYGKIIKSVTLPLPDSSGNEPHHVGISANGRTMACGGLLSVLKGQKEVFFFDLSNPVEPRFLSAVDVPNSAITDEFYTLDNGGFLVTMMGGAGASSRPHGGVRQQYEPGGRTPRQSAGRRL